MGILRKFNPKGKVYENLSVAELYEEAIRSGEPGTFIASTGALVALSGERTGRSPSDKRIVRNPESEKDIWWGSVNIELVPGSFEKLRDIALAYLGERERLFVVDGYAGWDADFRLKVRVICERTYHALFMKNMLIRPTREELRSFGEPDVTIINAGKAAADPSIPGVTSETCVALNIKKGEMVILGTEYAGEMKKGIFTLMNYIMPKKGVLSMHCSANRGDAGDVSLFFGLSGTGKTTLSADPHRQLIGDDEHCWSEKGVFNIEGGCYAKVINLSREAEPEIFNAIRFGTVLENVKCFPGTREVDYNDGSITQNTRASYPIEYISNSRIPCVGSHPTNIIFLTCDAFGVLPPLSRLSRENMMYYFISGYTAKVAGTEVGVTEPEATFSACFGAPFLVWHPMKYAELLGQYLIKHSATAWLVNTGWTGGAFGEGQRISIKYTRALIDAIHSGKLKDGEYQKDPVFGLEVPTAVDGVPSEILFPRKTWREGRKYDETARNLAGLFRENFEEYAGRVSADVLGAAPGTF